MTFAWDTFMSVVFVKEREIMNYEPETVESGMAAASESHSGLFWQGSQERCTKNRIQTTIYRQAAGDAIGTSSDKLRRLSI